VRRAVHAAIRAGYTRLHVQSQAICPPSTVMIIRDDHAA
jgi:hypothetical protein